MYYNKYKYYKKKYIDIYHCQQGGNITKEQFCNIFRPILKILEINKILKNCTASKENIQILQ